MQTDFSIHTQVGADGAIGRGAWTVPLSIKWASSGDELASGSFTYWLTPRLLSVSFNSAGNGVQLVLDTPTDRAVVTNARVDCDAALQLPSDNALGVEPTCVWAAPDTLQVSFGCYASLSLGDTVGLVNVSSPNGIAEARTLVAAVGSPALAVQPSLHLQGPTAFDACTPLQVGSLLWAICAEACTELLLKYNLNRWWRGHRALVHCSLLGRAAGAPAAAGPAARASPTTPTRCCSQDGLVARRHWCWNAVLLRCCLVTNWPALLA